MTETNVNTSGQGTTNWNLPPGTQPKLDPATGKPIPDQGVEVEAGIGMTGTEELVQDTVITSTQADASLYVVGNRPDTTAYTASSNRPALTPSTVNDPQLAESVLNSTVNPSKGFLESTLNNIVNSFPNGLNPELTPEEEQVVVTDPQILKLAEESGVSPQVVLKNVQTEKNNAFQELINKLPDKDLAKVLTFAFYVPEGAMKFDEIQFQISKFNPQYQETFDRINAAVNKEVAANFKFSADWPGVATNSTEFRAQLSMDADTVFAKLLNAKMDEGGLSASDAATLRAMNNGMATGTPTLKNILQQLQAQMTSQLRAKYGFDVSYQPKGDVTAYNAIVNGDFAQTYQKLVAKYTGTATAEQRALLEKYAANPKDPSIPDNIKQLAKQLADERQLLLQAFPNPDKASMPESLKAAAKVLIAEGISAIVTKYGLDLSWTPTINALVSPFVDPAGLKLATNAMDIAKDVFSRAQDFVNGMPDGVQKTQYLQYLKIIGQALITIQEAIYGMQAAQTKISGILGRGRLESQLNDIAQQQAAADETRRKEAKQAKLGPLGDALAWIGKIALLAFAAWLGPVAFAVALAYVVDSTVAEATGSKSGMQSMFSEIAKSMPPAAAAFVNGAIVAVISLATLNPFIAANLVTQDSKLMETIVQAAGGSKDQQMMAGLVFSIVVQVVVMAALMVCTGGAATAATVGKVAQTMASVAQISVPLATKIVKASMTTVQVVLASMQVASSGVKLNNSLLQMQMDMLKGQSEAYSEEVQAMIAMLKKLVEKLLALMEGNGDMLVNINTLQGKKWSEVSEQSTAIFG